MTDNQRLWLLELAGYGRSDYEKAFVVELGGFRVHIHRVELLSGAVTRGPYYDLSGGWYSKIEPIDPFMPRIPNDFQTYMDKLILEDAKNRLYQAGEKHQTLTKELYEEDNE